MIFFLITNLKFAWTQMCMNNQVSKAGSGEPLVQL